jgi:hypothetical protein
MPSIRGGAYAAGMTKTSRKRVFDDGITLLDFPQPAANDSSSADDREPFSTARVSITSVAVVLGILTWAVANAYLGG